MSLHRVVRWAERRAIATGNRGALGRALLSSLWATLGFPVLWLAATAMAGGGEDAVLYGLALAAALSMAGYAVTLSLIRRWSR